MTLNELEAYMAQSSCRGMTDEDKDQLRQDFQSMPVGSRVRARYDLNGGICRRSTGTVTDNCVHERQVEWDANTPHNWRKSWLHACHLEPLED